jgi:hypothetical protein
MVGCAGPSVPRAHSRSSAYSLPIGGCCCHVLTVAGPMGPGPWDWYLSPIVTPFLTTVCARLVRPLPLHSFTAKYYTCQYACTHRQRFPCRAERRCFLLIVVGHSDLDAQSDTSTVLYAGPSSPKPLMGAFGYTYSTVHAHLQKIPGFQ